MQRTNCLKQTNKQQQRIKTVLSTYAVAQKKKNPPKNESYWGSNRPLRYRCRALTIELASELGADHFLFL